MMGILVIVAALVLLTGCGHSQQDPFVGTWQASPGGASLVIARVGQSYRATVVTPAGPFGWLATGNGNELKATLKVVLNRKPTGRSLVQIIDVNPTTEHLTYQESGGPAVEFNRINVSTNIPTPAPS
jgi:hypothetical protein